MVLQRIGFSSFTDVTNQATMIGKRLLHFIILGTNGSIVHRAEGVAKLLALFFGHLSQYLIITILALTVLIFQVTIITMNRTTSPIRGPNDILLVGAFVGDGAGTRCIGVVDGDGDRHQRTHHRNTNQYKKDNDFHVSSLFLLISA